MVEYKVNKTCFYLGRRYKAGDIINFDGEVIPEYFEKISESIKTVKEKKQKQVDFE